MGMFPNTTIYQYGRLNSLPNVKFLDRFKLKALADDKINVTEQLKFVLGRVENIMGKVENASFPQKISFWGC